jgi:hypothetical protein
LAPGTVVVDFVVVVVVVLTADAGGWELPQAANMTLKAAQMRAPTAPLRVVDGDSDTVVLLTNDHDG